MRFRNKSDTMDIGRCCCCFSSSMPTRTLKLPHVVPEWMEITHRSKNIALHMKIKLKSCDSVDRSRWNSNRLQKQRQNELNHIQAIYSCVCNLQRDTKKKKWLNNRHLQHISISVFAVSLRVLCLCVLCCCVHFFCLWYFE